MTTILCLLALWGATPAHAEEEPAPDPEVVLAVGPRMAASLNLGDIEWFAVDAMAQLSIEARIDRRTSARLELGGNPVRGRIHVAGAGRVYPSGRAGTNWYGELSFHFQRTGAREDPDRWAPRPNRVWTSFPFLYGLGWRVFLSDTVILDVGSHAGPTFEVRPQEQFPVGFGLAATGHLMIGGAF